MHNQTVQSPAQFQLGKHELRKVRRLARNVGAPVDAVIRQIVRNAIGVPFRTDSLGYRVSDACETLN